ncbi:hypothetical protein Tco_0761968 [Tanacetum coccineum]
MSMQNKKDSSKFLTAKILSFRAREEDLCEHLNVSGKVLVLDVTKFLGRDISIEMSGSDTDKVAPVSLVPSFVVILI